MKLPAILIILGAIVALVVAVKVLLLLLGLTLGLVTLLAPLVWFVLLIAGLYSCITSSKPTNIKLLWVIVMILAPFLGSLLWFFWGKANT